MDQLFKLQNEKTWKSLLVTDDRLMFVNKSYNSTEEFTTKFNEKGLLKERLEIFINTITKISYLEKEEYKATISYMASKEKTLELIFVNRIEQQNFIDIIAKAQKMQVTTQQVSALKAIGPLLIGLAITALFTFIVYSDAATIEQGGDVDTSGRRSLYKRLFAWLAELLGTQGTIAAGVGIGLVCLYFIYKRLQSKPNEIIYS